MKTLGIWDEIKTLDTETSIPPTSMKIVYRFWYLYVAAVLPNKGAEIKLKDMFWVKISYRIGMKNYGSNQFWCKYNFSS